MGQKFDMGDGTLQRLTQQTSGAGDELSDLIRKLVKAAEPLAGKFSGSGKVAFDHLKNNSEQVANELSRGLGSVNAGQAGMDKSFKQGDSEMADQARSAMASANFDPAKYRA